MMESRMETTIIGYIGIVGYILGICWDNGKWKLPSGVSEISFDHAFVRVWGFQKKEEE